MSYSSPEIPTNVVDGFVSIINRMNQFIIAQDLQAGDYRVKQDDSPVGDLDVAIENFVELQMREYLPGFQMIGEESPFPSQWNGNYLVIDPVDGTENFVSGIPIWGTGLAIFINNQLVASYVSFPEIGMGYASRVLRGLIQNDSKGFRGPLRRSRVDAYSSNSAWGAVVSDFRDEIRVFGCSLFNLILAATSSVNFKSSSKGVRLWDIVPAALVALEYGKSVRINGEEYFGEFLDPNLRFVVEIQG